MDIVVTIIIALILAFAVLIGRRLLRHRGALNEMRKLGLTPNQFEKIQEELQSGNREAALQRIANIQKQQRTDFLKEGFDIQAMTPIIGRDIEWIDIVSQVFRVLEFDRAGTIVGSGDTVKAASSSNPYGYLLVESPIFNQPAKLPIVHRDDFLLAASVFDEPQLLEVIEKEELLVTYVPKHKLPKGLIGMSHALHYVITPRGTLDRYYEVENDGHMTKPEPEKIFGTLVWDGEIKVQVNPRPEI